MMTPWVVVTSYADGRPIHTDGPYSTREQARSVKRMLDVDERVGENHEFHHTVTRLTRLITPTEFEEWMSTRTRDHAT